MDGRAMRVGKAGADREHVLDPLPRDGPHRDDHRSAELARGHGLDHGAEHRNRGVVLDVPYADAGPQQGVLEGEGTSEREGDEILPPQIRDVGGRHVEAAVPVDVVGGKVAADVDLAPERPHQGIAGIGDADQRAGLRIALAEAHEVERRRLRHDREVGLQAADPEAGRVRSVAAPPDRAPDLAGRRFPQIPV